MIFFLQWYAVAVVVAVLAVEPQFVDCRSPFALGTMDILLLSAELVPSE